MQSNIFNAINFAFNNEKVVQAVSQRSKQLNAELSGISGSFVVPVPNNPPFTNMVKVYFDFYDKYANPYAEDIVVLVANINGTLSIFNIQNAGGN